MKIKKILITLVLIALTIGAVSASDNITGDLTADNTVELDTADQYAGENVLSEKYNVDIVVDEDIEILPAPNQSIDIYSIKYTTGNISLSIDDIKQNVTVNYKEIAEGYDILLYLEFDATNLSYGQHKYDLNFTGDDTYRPAAKSGTLTVSPIILKVPSEVYLKNTFENSRQALDDRGYIEIQYLKNMTGNVYLNINGARKTINLSNYKAKGDKGSVYDGYSCYMYDFEKYNLIKFDKRKGCYVYMEYYYFSEPSNITMKYENITKTSFVNVTYELKCYNELVKGSNLDIFIPKGISDKVSVEIDGKKTKLYTAKTNSDYGRINFYVKTGSLNYGKHTIKIISPLYTLSKTFTVVDEYVSPKTASMYYTESKTLALTVYGEGEKVVDAGEDVEIRIDNAYYANKYAKKNGQVSVKVPKNLKPGTHIISVETYADDHYISGKLKLTVKHLVTLKTVKVKKSSKKLILQATLKKAKTPLKGKQVTFKFNGKTYKAKTSSKGIAKVTIKSDVLKKLKAGKKITYMATYLKDTVKKTVKIQK